MTTQDHIQAFRSDVASFGQRVDSFLQVLSPQQEYDNLMMNEVPINPEELGITEKQKNLLVDLIHQKFSNKLERERFLAEVGTMSKFDASEMISSLLMGAR